MDPIAQVATWMTIGGAALGLLKTLGEWFCRLQDGSRARWFRRYTIVSSEGEEHLYSMIERYNAGRKRR